MTSALSVREDRQKRRFKRAAPSVPLPAPYKSIARESESSSSILGLDFSVSLTRNPINQLPVLRFGADSPGKPAGWSGRAQR